MDARSFCLAATDRQTSLSPVLKSEDLVMSYSVTTLNLGLWRDRGHVWMMCIQTDEV